MPHILKHSSAVIAVSDATKLDLTGTFDISPSKVHVVYNGYDAERFRIIKEPDAVLRRYGLLGGEYFLFVGSILRHKNLHRLVQAFAKVRGESKLVIVGICKDEAYLREVINAANSFGIMSRRLLYLEYVPDDDLPYLYNGAIAFVLPSLHEGFGVPLIEAMACGTPVITSNCSAMPEVAGGAALLVEPYSVDSIASAMRELLANSRRVEELRSAGLNRAMSFRWSYSAQKLYDVCKMVSES
jgi:glycosyltransferase involved in cell wall biosynthesis